MPQRTFLRYQLQNGIRQLPASLSLFEAALDTDKAMLAAHLAELEEIREREVQRLRLHHSVEIAQLHGKRVLFLGDSLTADELGYRPLVTQAAALAARNGAISGGTTASLLHICRQKIFSKHSPTPDIISIMLGTNDSVSIEREELHQVSLMEYARNMRQILSWAKKSGARILLFAIPPVLEQQFCAHAASNGKLQSNRAIDAYNARLTELARELGVEVITHALPDAPTALFEEDGLHWSAAGQVHFAAQWLKSATKIII